jgi:Cdc6-like AAA superfamily ATPase
MASGVRCGIRSGWTIGARPRGGGAGDLAEDPKHPDHRLIERLDKINQHFRPAAPIDNRALFAGRIKQLGELIDVIEGVGQHGILYGERGVGKTSLAAVMQRMLIPKKLAIRVNCDPMDNFASIWGKVVDNLVRLLEKLSEVEIKLPEGLSEAVEESVGPLAVGDVGPREVMDGLHVLTKVMPVVIFVDEFDSLLDDASRGLFSNTIKMLSDQTVDATLVLVGVADTVDELILEHESVERNLTQILMPRMNQEELTQIVTSGLSAADLSIEDSALDRIVKLSQGLPHYTHLLAKHAARLAVLQGRNKVTLADVEAAVASALQKMQQSIVRLYQKATSSPQRDHLFDKVLLACALAAGLRRSVSLSGW